MTTTTTDTTSEGSEEGTQGSQEGEQIFDASYVAGLRDEAAGYRQRARDAEQRAQRAEEALWEAIRTEASAGILADPTDLLGTVDMLDEHGLPNAQRIR